MKQLPPDRQSLLARIAALGLSAAANAGSERNGARFLADRGTRVSLTDLGRGTSFDPGGAHGQPDALRGKSVLVATASQMATSLSLIELDGVARRLVLCPPDLGSEHIPQVLETAAIDAVVVDPDGAGAYAEFGLPRIICRPGSFAPRPSSMDGASGNAAPTEWVMFTSGTTGRPKMVVHDLDSLSAPMAGAAAFELGSVWSTFYDIRRYGGMQMLLRALLGGGSMVLSDATEARGDFLARVSRAGVTHISGTPSHWRQALMSPKAAGFAPRYVRLSGEIADQAVLDRLRAAFPAATVAHAFASTEAGVAFSVADGREGFPASLIEQDGPVRMRLENGSLRIQSARTASRYLGEGMPELTDADGFVDTGDLVERDADRYRFTGRREGIINVGGLKVHPEEVEAAINRHPHVQMSRARSRRSPITGSVVVADVVAHSTAAGDGGELEAQILKICGTMLPRHKVPVAIHFVAKLEVSPNGKLARRLA